MPGEFSRPLTKPIYFRFMDIFERKSASTGGRSPRECSTVSKGKIAMRTHCNAGRLGQSIAGLVLAILAAYSPQSAHASNSPTPRQLVQHLLRRFAFSASPAEVSAVQAEGINTW